MVLSYSFYFKVLGSLTGISRSFWPWDSRISALLNSLNSLLSTSCVSLVYCTCNSPPGTCLSLHCISELPLPSAFVFKSSWFFLLPCVSKMLNDWSFFLVLFWWFGWLLCSLCRSRLNRPSEMSWVLYCVCVLLWRCVRLWVNTLFALSVPLSL